VIRGAKKVPALEVPAALEDAEKKPKLVSPNQPIGALAMATTAVSVIMLLS